MKIPTVHLNGTSKESLIAGYRDAYQAIDAAIDAVRLTGPHGRDYYVQTDPDALQVAIIEHTERLRKLHVLKTEMEELAIAVQDQGKR